MKTWRIVVYRPDILAVGESKLQQKTQEYRNVTKFKIRSDGGFQFKDEDGTVRMFGRTIAWEGWQVY
jgi:hypothetical protein